MRISYWSSDVCSSDLIQAARRQRGTKLVVVDPRRTETCEDADLHLAIRPGTDVALMNGLLAHCRDQGLIDEAFLGQSVNVPDGFWDGLRSEEHTSELQSLMRISYAVFCLKKQKTQTQTPKSRTSTLNYRLIVK